ncbi:AfsR/SARP family transcriptional regulator [Streptomyces liangshanensis]|uniref:Transcriptional regulator n=1 Tax=Streptomyces liangshanensis TaxID=2717324 RepID=A0A6G9H2K9_9ACTN|nr:BTAD domain-containing putative transcriptional regulator [Streptomyces liangshanensis]QIQ04367.1 transcriptional regulator [Streptomyces liangshanensis]
MGDRLCFKVLGPLIVVSGERKVVVGGARQRTVLSLLLLSPGRTVPVDTLVDEVWNGSPPATARTQIAIVVAALRKTFKAEGAGDDTIVTAHPGYLLNTEGHYVDSVDFTELVARAEAEAAEGRLDDAAVLYRRALGLWRGPALAGVSGLAVEEEAARLQEHRLNAYDDATAVQLALGRHYELVPELAGVVREHPLRERTRHHLMLAQYRSGRRAEAMESYREAREVFVEELGLEPGPDLQELHDLILRDDPSLTGEGGSAGPAAVAGAPDVVVVPSELPPDVPGFTGREGELAALDGLVTELAAGEHRPAVGLVTGVAGVGKSGLVVHWAHRVAEAFPDGRLFADLRGYDGEHEPVSVSDVLSRFLRSLGVRGPQVPDALEERVALYRSLLSERRVLIVLDNVRTFAQLRPLLPGSGASCALITSRDQLEQLVTWPHAARVHLGVLPRQEAVELVGRIAGEERIAARADVVRLVELCDRLPLAVRIAAARLASKPHWSVRHMVGRLSDERRRLDELSQGESQVRAGFELSYRYLPLLSARLYRCLGLVDVPDFTSWVAAALLDVDVLDAELLLEDLVDAQFLEVVGIDATGRLRYRLQNLLRLYAAERARQDDPAGERQEALRRVFATGLSIAEEAHRREHGGDFSIVHSGVSRRLVDSELLEELLVDPLEWFEAERLCLVGMVEQAARMGMAGLAWDLTVSSAVLFETRGYIDNWRVCAGVALDAARAAGDVRGQAAMLQHQGAIALSHHSMDDAVARSLEALELFASAGEELGRALVLRNLAVAYRITGEVDRVAECLTAALPVFRAVGDRSSEASALQSMAQLELDRGDPAAALGHALEAVRVAEPLGSGGSRNLAQSLYRVGSAQFALNRFAEAEAAHLRVEELSRAKCDDHGLAHALFGLGQARAALGAVEQAERAFVEGRSIAQGIDSPLIEGRIRLGLGVLLGERGRWEEGRVDVLRAGELFKRSGATPWEEEVARVLGEFGTSG